MQPWMATTRRKFHPPVIYFHLLLYLPFPPRICLLYKYSFTFCKTLCTFGIWPYLHTSHCICISALFNPSSSFKSPKCLGRVHEPSFKLHYTPSSSVLAFFVIAFTPQPQFIISHLLSSTIRVLFYHARETYSPLSQLSDI